MCVSSPFAHHTSANYSLCHALLDCRLDRGSVENNTYMCEWAGQPHLHLLCALTFGCFAMKYLHVSSAHHHSSQCTPPLLTVHTTTPHSAHHHTSQCTPPLLTVHTTTPHSAHHHSSQCTQPLLTVNTTTPHREHHTSPQ